MSKLFLILITFCFLYCGKKYDTLRPNKAGTFRGEFKHGNFSDSIQFTIERNTNEFKVFFSSLAQKAVRIPAQNVTVLGDSISFLLQSDRYTYYFKNKWIKEYSIVEGSLIVKTDTTKYQLRKVSPIQLNDIREEEVVFKSHGNQLQGSIWYPEKERKKGLVLLTSSGHEDRSASRAEAIILAKNGYTLFHYDKRGTGNSEGEWEPTSIEQLALDDIAAIRHFSYKTGIPLGNIGIMGSSQGATKVPLILNKLTHLRYGVMISCPGSSLLESDLNFWKNRNSELIGDDLTEASQIQKAVFEHISGKLPRKTLEEKIYRLKHKKWISKIWLPKLDEVQIDKKLNYSPLPHLEKTKQPVLIIQGMSDEIIPANSYKIISKYLERAKNKEYQVILLDKTSHSMSYDEESDFPYWSKIHPEYIKTINDWIITMYD
ncbi:alpha/beta hydrolase family protein [Maribacter sp. HTCC2170]|uniref:alpha/beta hydrolase family protein n=1 Tax=Maribacter sp. (strain HTCC2170 / KCCM 42371) TaxID=313603 RepID=UPI00006AFD8E|nr:CocE/NonD family hydrolase [Maribacter sp. HTCC2170]EAR01397.1 hypothetical protein FB2170_11771 [Maribacter sp. HTCC2170]